MSSILHHHPHIAWLRFIRLRISKEWGALSISRCLASAPRDLLACPCRNSDQNCKDKEDGHDGKRKDPLEGHNLSVKLSNAKGGRQDTETETHGVVLRCVSLGLYTRSRKTYLEGEDIEETVTENRPDEDIGEDASDKTSLVRDHDSSVPIYRHKGPRQRARDGRQMDESGIHVVAEVERREVDEVDDQHNLGQDKVRADEQHHPGEVKQVIDNEVASHRACRIDCLDFGGEEVADVSELQDENDKPVLRKRQYPSHSAEMEANIPVQRGDNVVLGETRVVDIVDSPNCRAEMIVALPMA